jgi:hypothetical protein
MEKRRTKTRVERLLNAQGIPSVRMSEAEREKAQRDWRHVYGRPVHDKLGVWTVDGIDWHAFCRGITPCLAHEAAMSAYRRLEPKKFLILPNLDEGFAYSCGGGRYPDFSGKRHDVYVCPRSMDWAMAFDHEEMGPYFSSPTIIAEAAI